MTTNELLLKTLFCCSACDGEIAPEEVELIKNVIAGNEIFAGLDIEALLNNYVEQINREGQNFLKRYLCEVADGTLSDNDQITLVDLAVKMIEADNQILYSEVKFFKKIRRRLSVSDESILAALPQTEDYLLPDIMVDEKDDEWSNITFDNIILDGGQYKDGE